MSSARFASRAKRGGLALFRLPFVAQQQRRAAAAASLDCGRRAEGRGECCGRRAENGQDISSAHNGHCVLFTFAPGAGPGSRGARFDWAKICSPKFIAPTAAAVATRLAGKAGRKLGQIEAG